ncbi:hypothetical protein KO481_35340 [Nocardia sp. NEAU-G5]|uniref:Secreted protein n=1 Tax=Nocardia albiluteola TaxID=2842303 RepID=A0ABS6BAH4_9NOCA|nr:hypothetical protein [Nocardia albiluteola]MBU3066780.1 hypothetical protein [Nocardia albiluteola]
MTRNSSTGSPKGRVVGRIALAAALVAAPMFTAAAAMAEPVPQAATHVVAGPGIVQADYDDWYYWHCTRWHEYWRPRCHPQPQPQVLPPTGSSL